MFLSWDGQIHLLALLYLIAQIFFFDKSISTDFKRVVCVLKSKIWIMLSDSAYIVESRAIAG